MTKKHFIALADEIRNGVFDKTINRFTGDPGTQQASKMELAESLTPFLSRQNPNFNRQRWLDYIEGKVGPSGGAR